MVHRVMQEWQHIAHIPSLVSEGSFFAPVGSGMHKSELSMGPGRASSSITIELASLPVRETPLA